MIVLIRNFVNLFYIIYLSTSACWREALSTEPTKCRAIMQWSIYHTELKIISSSPIFIPSFNIINWSIRNTATHLKNVDPFLVLPLFVRNVVKI